MQRSHKIASREYHQDLIDAYYDARIYEILDPLWGSSVRSLCFISPRFHCLNALI